MTRLKLAAGVFALACSTLLLPGCLIVSDSSVDEYGARISHSTLNQIEPGVTTEAWLIAALGEPHSCIPIQGDEGAKIIRYDYSVEKDADVTIFLLCSIDTDHDESIRTYFELRDGVVTRYWSES